MKHFKTLIELIQTFSNENKCIEHLKSIRWKDGSFCPFCGETKIYEFKNKKTFKCSSCRKQFSIRVGTIFEDSKISLQKWFMAIYLVTAHKKGISSLQLSKDIGVTQKTAWFMLHRLRHASKTNIFNEPLKNEVEADETYIGGKEKNKHYNKKTKGTQGRSTATKTAVLGIIERKGHIKAFKIENTENNTIQSKLVDNISIGSKLFTDEFKAYKGLSWLFSHKCVTHSKNQYVAGNIHTNTIEGFWSILKRGINGIYHFVSNQHLDSYLAEYSFRYNTKDMKDPVRFNFFLNNIDGKLMYKDLINA